MVDQATTAPLRHKTYSEKLRDPRWQRKRVEVLQRDNYECVNCGDDETELHVHHRLYDWGKEPWDYLDKDLETLCKPCHDRKTECGKLIKKIASALALEWIEPETARMFLETLTDEFAWHSAEEALLIAAHIMRDKDFGADCWDLMVQRFSVTGTS